MIISHPACKQCGEPFEGGVRAEYCSSCLKKRQKEQVKAYLARKKQGEVQQPIDWTDVDWSLPTKEIAAQKGVCYDTARIQRRKHIGPSYIRSDWSDVDWSRPLAEIAAEKGVKYTTAYMARRRFCGDQPMPHAPRQSPPSSVARWRGVDWSNRNADIAHELGVSYQAVSRARRKYGSRKSGPLPDAERFSLLGGPYLAPDVRPGDWLEDAERGSVQVGGYTETARIPWPRLKKTGKASLILCGDLIRAVQTESALAIGYWWGVSGVVVARWRKVLGISQTGSEGSLQLYRKYTQQKLPEAVAARGREKALSPESKAQRVAKITGRPAHPATREALLEAAKRPKSAEWIEKQKENLRRQWQDGLRNRTPVWTPEADAKLLALHAQGLTVRQIAQKMRKTRASILSRLQLLRAGNAASPADAGTARKRLKK